MTEDNLIQQMRDMRYPGQVDVVDSVMTQVAGRPILAPVPLRNRTWFRVVSAVAACALLAVGVNMTLLQTRHFDTNSIGSCLAEVYDYHADYGTTADAGYYIGVEELFY